MKLSYLAFQLPNLGIEVCTFRSSGQVTFHRAALLTEGAALSEDTLYLVSYEEQELAADQRGTAFCVYNCPEDLKPALTNGLYIPARHSAASVINTVTALTAEFSEWELLLRCAESADLEDLLDRSEKLLGMPIVVTDNHFGRRARSRHAREVLPERDTDTDGMADFFWTETFRKCMNERDVFHVRVPSEGLMLLCYNIFDGNIFYGRIVGASGEDSLKPVQEELFEELCRSVVRMFAEQRLQAGDHEEKKDLLEQLERLADGRADVNEAVLRRNRWYESDLFQVIVITFDPNYPMEEGRHFLIRRLGEIFPEGCVIARGPEMICVRNLNQAAVGDVWDDSLAVFLRENIANAGLSNPFQGIKNLYIYIKQAHAALRLGKARDPHFWRFEFRKYVPAYLLEQCIAEYPAEQIIHPGLRELREYDRRNGTELFRTLRVYLEEGCSATRAAEILFIHRSSLIKRIEKVRTVTGIDLDDERSRLYVHLSFKLLQREAEKEPGPR